MKAERELLLMGVGLAVRRLRDGRGMTRRGLARKSGVSERFLADLEAGQGNISVARLHEVARALGTSAGELLLAEQRSRRREAPDAPRRAARPRTAGRSRGRTR